MNDTKYNGWKNYPTWNVKLWLENSPETQAFVIRLYKNAQKSVIPTLEEKEYFSRQEWTRFEFRDALENALYTQAHQELSEASMFTDLLRWSLGEVDWNQISKAYQEEFEHDA